VDLDSLICFQRRKQTQRIAAYCNGLTANKYFLRSITSLSLFILLSYWHNSIAAVTPQSDFDHSVTGFPLSGAHENLDCVVCHTGGVFSELPTNCEDCHDNFFAPGKSVSHIPTTQSCAACHTTVGFGLFAAASFDHSLFIGTACISCHDGVAATGKSSSHIKSSDACETCHSVLAWSPVIGFDHMQTSEACVICHVAGGSAKRSKTAGHLSTSDNCESCHSVYVWIPATAVDHDQVIGECASCHGGATRISSGAVSSKSVNHVRASDLCGSCHNVEHWRPITTVDHSQVFDACIVCHNGVNASGKHAQHIATSNNCQTCHATTQWKPAIAVDHGEVSGSCASCHDGVVAGGKAASHLQTSDDCGVCHATDVWTPLLAIIDHANINDQCVSCHNGLLASGKSNAHMASTDNCQLCHNKFPALWRPVEKTAVDHSQVLGSCVSCHDGARASGKHAAHIASSDQCDACHDAGPVPWAPLANNRVNHAHVVGTCSSCHDGVIASGKSATHVPTNNECSDCHAVTAWVPVLVDHSGFVNNCISCHDGVQASGKSTTHIASSDACESCHDKLPALWKPVAAARVDHSQVRGSCVSCHDGAIASGKLATHIASSNQCNACHAVGPTPWKPVAPSAVDHSQVIGVCLSQRHIGIGQNADPHADHR